MDWKGKRKRSWKANQNKAALKAFVDWKDMVDAQGKVDVAKFKAMTEWLYQWAHDMHAWGQDVRDDIVRLEGRAGFASGDPGDPPDGPPNDE